MESGCCDGCLIRSVVPLMKTAQEMMGHQKANGQFGGQAFMLMRMVANGSAVVRFGEDSDSSGMIDGREVDDSDPDYQHEDDSDDSMEGL